MSSLFTLFAFVFGISVSFCLAEAPKVKTLEIGAAAPAFKLPGVDDKNYSLADFKGSDYLVIIFTCNHCPDARASWGRINEFAKNYADKGVQVVAVSTNSPKALMAWENGYSVFGDSFPEMKLEAAERKLVFPYLYDGDKQEAGLAYGARATPHVFIFGPERKLLYQGHFDNGHRNPGPASKNTVRDNIDTLLSGGEIREKTTRVFGCSTKWAYKQEWAQKTIKAWAALPVTVDPLDVSSVKSLFENKTKRVRVITIWKTDSNLNSENFPKLIDTYRRYQRRPFEMITLGFDDTDDGVKVQKVLTEHHLPLSPETQKYMKEGRNTNNYHLKSSDSKALAGMLEKDEDIAIPSTVVIAPEGEIIHRQEGNLNAVELRRAIVEGLENIK